MSRSSLKYGAIAAVLLGAVLVVSYSERIRCVLARSCGIPTATALPEEAEQTATTTVPVVATTTTTASTTSKTTPTAAKRLPAKKAVPASSSKPVAQVAPAEPPVVEEGPTTFSVSAIPLLVGGEVRGGESIPLSYLKVMNRGPYAARLQGFWVRQNGNAPARTVIRLSTVDDKGGSRGQTEGPSPFTDNVAFAPTDALFLPGQMKLFTIKGTVRSNINAYIGTELKIDVDALQAKDVTFTGPFPIRGTTWTLAE